MECDNCKKKNCVGVVGFKGIYLCYDCAKQIYGSLEEALQVASKALESIKALESG